MTKRVQLVRHDNAGSAAFQGKIGEITVNTGNKSVHVHDGINEGGTEQARADLNNVAVATASNVGKMSAQQAAELAQALLDIVTNAGNITSNDTDIATNIANILTNTTKLDTIETNADVTDTANVTAAGALMDSEVDVDIKTLSLPASTTISAFGRTLIDDAAASNARITLGLGGLAILNGVSQAEVNANAIGQSELKTTTGEVSTTSSIFVNSTLAGGSYGFYPQVRETGDGMLASMVTGGTQVGATYVTIISLRVSSSGIAYAQQRYIQASPPYDLGDGEVGRFIFAIINNATGAVESVYQATEAPWHYNGPTDIRGKLAADGKKYRTRRDMSGHPLSLAQARLNIGTLRAYNSAFHNAPSMQEEITQNIKNADMNLIPHPFMANDLTGKTVVMLDPVSDLNFELDELSQHAEFNINELLHDGYLKVDNVGLSRSGPAGILIPSFSWKNSQ